ncbi:MAG: hypothetical protein K9J12_12220 [Melioribacteraceae bacterium]|nr:hypothetical protein [Melioribacteraceae bacterium]MCF8263752.1 hypothetical protein [Melioribacteraceae bacterium]MCF8412667.1 hypothetical protein [Melioribacteraceae bacterium]MCF8430987.1 hypothetical protein [Melioribacteraceae bacterium]
MTGKASLFLLMGFSIIFLVAGHRFGQLTTTAVGNLSDYYEETVLHNIAVSGANIAANQLFFDPTWNSGYSNIDFAGGTYSVSVQTLDYAKNIKKLTSTATYLNETKTVEVTLQPSKFSKFSYYSGYEPSGIWWTSGDTVWGPTHIQGYLRVDQSPVFFGKATCRDGLYENGYWSGWWWNRTWVSTADPKFYGGFEQGIDLPLPNNGVDEVETDADDSGFKFTGQDTVFLNFVGDSLKYKFHDSDQDTTVLVSDITSNGVIFVDEGTVRIKGIISGQITVGVSGSGSHGSVYIDNDITYLDDPITNVNSSDIFGLITEQNIWISDNAANNSDINIQGSLYAENGGFGAENYSSRPPSGSINLLGGIIQSTRKAVGTFGGGSIQSGFSKKYKYDDRFMITSPPSFPGTGTFEIVSWYE